MSFYVGTQREKPFHLRCYDVKLLKPNSMLFCWYTERETFSMSMLRCQALRKQNSNTMLCCLTRRNKLNDDVTMLRCYVVNFFTLFYGKSLAPEFLSFPLGQKFGTWTCFHQRRKKWQNVSFLRNGMFFSVSSHNISDMRKKQQILRKIFGLNTRSVFPKQTTKQNFKIKYWAKKVRLAFVFPNRTQLNEIILSNCQFPSVRTIPSLFLKI